MRSAKQKVQRDRFLAMVRDIETRLIQVPAGTQDYYPALWGGIQALWWRPGGGIRESLRVSAQELEKRLLLVYTGTSRHSGTNNWEVFKRHLDGDRGVRRMLGRIGEAGREMASALVRGDYRGVGQAMAEEAAARRGLFPGIVTRDIQRLERSLRALGAMGTKVCGAGGGGCVIVYADPGDKSPMEEKVRQMGYRLLPFKIVKKGLSFRSADIAKTAS
jgi:D-glycero-alpha-D-manno-heptose-7-phosphate kinase